MSTYFRITSTLALAAVLAAGGTTAARAQDTSSATRSDTMGYQPSGGQTDTTMADTSNAGHQNAPADTGFKSQGAPSDTALRAKPGVQTGPAIGDSGQAASRAGAAGTADTVVCKDGSNAAKQVGCKAHGGIDKAATRAALKARGSMTGYGADSTAMPADSGQNSDSAQTK